MALTLRSVKGSQLTHAEGDANFSGLADGSLSVFTPAGAGAVAGTVPQKLKLEINLWDALSSAQRADIGTASLDVSAAIATAIGWFGATGGILFIPGLVGLGATGISLVSKTGIVIEGRGPSAGFKILTVSATAVTSCGVSSIRMTGSSRCGFRNLYIDNTSKANNVIAGSANTDSFVEGCTIVNGGLSASIFFVGGTGNRFVRNTIKDSAASSRGLWIGNVNAGESETNCLIDSNYVNNTGATAIGGNLVRGVISNNRCIDSDGSGITQAALSTERANGVSIVGNVCKGNLFDGIQVGDSSSISDYVQHISVSGNVCESNQNYGIQVAKARDVTITGNTCRDNNVAGGSLVSGIHVLTGKRIVISGNMCDDTGVGAARTQQSGISAIAGTGSAALEIEDILISGNACRNNEAYGIFVQNNSGATIDTVSLIGNLCVDNATDGIRVAHESDGTLTKVVCFGNTCLGNGTNDIRLDPTDCTIGQNKFLTQSNLVPTFTSLDTTPSVAGRNLWKCANGSATAITNLDDGVQGQVVTIKFSNSNTTIADSGNFNLSAAYSSTADDVLVLILIDTIWLEVSRSAN